jgi:hypothetical protein
LNIASVKPTPDWILEGAVPELNPSKGAALISQGLESVSATRQFALPRDQN